jgi:hypothetical protein
MLAMKNYLNVNLHQLMKVLKVVRKWKKKLLQQRPNHKM